MAYLRSVSILFLVILLSSACSTQAPQESAVEDSPATQQVPLAVKPVSCNRSRGSCYAPPVGATWQWQLSCDTEGDCANLDVKVDWYVLDWEDTPASTVDTIHKQGAHASCYISIGTSEDWRADIDKINDEIVGNNYEDWSEVNWLDIRRFDLLEPIMTARMDVCKEKGFDGVQFDNVDGWYYETGFPLTQQDYALYAAKMANLAHSMGLSVVWQNAFENVSILNIYMDGFLMESCNELNICAAATPIIKANKFVGSVEYGDENQDMKFCETTNALKIMSMHKNTDLTSYRRACWNDGSPVGKIKALEAISTNPDSVEL